MIRLFVTLFVTTTMVATSFAQNFSSFSVGIPELQLSSGVTLEKESDAIRYPIHEVDARTILQEKEDEHYAIGKITLSKSVVIIYYTKPKGVAPLGKITAISFTSSGKKIATEAIGVFADFMGMHFRTTISGSRQDKGAVSITSNVEAIKDNGEVNESMSKISTYYFSAKGKITKM